MKQITAYLLSTLILFGSVIPFDFQDQLLRVPELIQHYHKHQKESKGKISFLTFLQMHYEAGSQHARNASNSEKDAHNSLPMLNCHTAPSYLLPTTITFSFIEPTLLSFREKPAFWWNNLYSFIPLSSLFNPPIGFVS